MLRAVSVIILFPALLRSDSLDAIVTRVIDALGGADNLAAIRSIKLEGTLQGTPLTVTARQPSLYRMDMGAGKEQITEAYDGSFAWRREAGPASPAIELHGSSVDRIVDQASNAIGGPLFQAAEKGNHIEYAGHSKIDGHELIQLRVTLLSGTTMMMSFDPATYREVREEITTTSSPPTFIEEAVSDFRKFGNVWIPCRFVSRPKDASQWYELLIQKVTLNPDAPDSLFTFPAVNSPNSH